MEKTIEEMKNLQAEIRIPNLDEMYNDVVKFVREHQGEKGYIDCQPYQEDAGDIIFTFEYNESSGWGEERMVYGVRWNEEEKDLEICFEPYMFNYHLKYDEKAFKGEYEDEDANAEWYSLRWSDIVYYIPTLFNIAESIGGYV